MKSSTPLLRWLLSSGADVGGRLLLQVLGTVVFTRLLDVEAFGTAALIAVHVGVLSMIVSGLFEEAIVQRRIVRTPHFSSALAALLLLSGLLWLLALLIAPAVPTGDAADIGIAPLPAYALIVFADGALSVYTAAARRQRRFADIALGNLGGLATGTAVGLALALSDAGVWALLAVQPVARLVNLAVMVGRCPVSIRPRLALAPLRQLAGYGGWHLGGRLLEGLGDVLFQTLVSRLFGLAGNGYLNMAMRVIEPIRGATSAIGHHLSMAHFARAQANPVALGASVRQTIVESALLLQPVFIGLAAVAPLAIEVIGGRQWAAAGPLAVLLALAAAVGSISNFVHGGIAARGRADIGFAFCGLELLLASGLLLLLAPFGLAAVGAARLLAWLIDAAAVMTLATRLIRLEVAVLLSALLPVASIGALMAGSVVAAQLAMPNLPPGLRLAVAIAIGVGSYAVLVLRWQKPLLDAVRSRLQQ